MCKFFCFPCLYREVVSIKRKIKDRDILGKLAEIAFGKGNDAVKLAFFDICENMEVVDGLDLTMLSEVKRGSNGAVEIKLLNRLEALELLAKLVDCGGNKGNSTKDFFTALDTAARDSSTNNGGAAGEI